MSKLRYTEEHEWLRADEDGLFTAGITSHAQHALGDLVYVQLPELRHYAAGEEIAVLESVKAASNILAPVSGEVVAVNEALEAEPGLSTPRPRRRAGSSVSAPTTTPTSTPCSPRRPTSAC